MVYAGEYNSNINLKVPERVPSSTFCVEGKRQISLRNTRYLVYIQGKGYLYRSQTAGQGANAYSEQYDRYAKQVRSSRILVRQLKTRKRKNIGPNLQQSFVVSLPTSGPVGEHVSLTSLKKENPWKRR